MDSGGFPNVSGPLMGVPIVSVAFEFRASGLGSRHVFRAEGLVLVVSVNLYFKETLIPLATIWFPVAT